MGPGRCTGQGTVLVAGGSSQGEGEGAGERLIVCIAAPIFAHAAICARAADEDTQFSYLHCMTPPWGPDFKHILRRANPNSIALHSDIYPQLRDGFLQIVSSASG